CRSGVVEVERSVTAVLGQDVVLPCRYRAQEQEQVVQVTWLKRGPGGRSAKVAVLDRQHGQHVQEPYVGRVLRRAPGAALEDSAIVLRNAVQGDEGDYECHLSTFPQGTFEGHLTLKVLVPPLPILNPGPPLEEGQGQTLAASCTAEGNPVPSVRWETEVRGTNTTRWSDHARSASVTSEFFLVPGRSMNGKSLTCVVAHPGLRHEKRITHILSVACAALGTGGSGDMGLEKIFKIIESNQMDVLIHLSIRPSTHQPSTHPWAHLSIIPPPMDSPIHPSPPAPPHVPADDEVRRVDLVSASVVVVGVIAAVLLCVLVVVVVVMTLYHKRKTKRISEKYEEELTLTRENSIRRLHSSHSTDTRTQGSPVTALPAWSPQSEEPEGRSYSTLSTVREIETQTEAPAVPLLPVPAAKEPKEEEEDGGGGGGVGGPIKQAMTHFVQENGMLQAKPTTNGIYINGRGHLV
ncbi:NECT4 protein, partial [Bucorvus abyssinicus]|nr:NECT4 protein [Bucorvus abyssinicus]